MRPEPARPKPERLEKPALGMDRDEGEPLDLARLDTADEVGERRNKPARIAEGDHLGTHRTTRSSMTPNMVPTAKVITTSMIKSASTLAAVGKLSPGALNCHAPAVPRRVAQARGRA